MTRKSPRRHTVKAHVRQNYPVKSFVRGIVQGVIVRKFRKKPLTKTQVEHVRFIRKVCDDYNVPVPKVSFPSLKETRGVTPTARCYYYPDERMVCLTGRIGKRAVLHELTHHLIKQKRFKLPQTEKGAWILSKVLFKKYGLKPQLEDKVNFKKYVGKEW